MLIYLQLGHFLDYLSITNATCTLIHANQKNQNNDKFYKAYVRHQVFEPIIFTSFMPNKKIIFFNLETNIYI